MVPLLPPQAPVFVAETLYEDIRIGDIAVFLKDNALICHRVLRKLTIEGKRYLETKADTAFTCDRLVLEKEIIGKIVALEIAHKVFAIDYAFFRLAGIACTRILPFIARTKYILSEARKSICFIQ